MTIDKQVFENQKLKNLIKLCDANINIDRALDLSIDAVRAENKMLRKELEAKKKQSNNFFTEKVWLRKAYNSVRIDIFNVLEKYNNIVVPGEDSD